MIGAILLGLLAGFLARALMPGRTPKGIIFTLVLGLAGAALGFLLFTKVLHIGDNHPFNLGGLPGAVIGAMILLWFGRRLSGR